MARFGFSRFPTAILVDGAGTIVEAGNASGASASCRRSSAPSLGGTVT